jgi:opacity protein-like surface antigen
MKKIQLISTFALFFSLFSSTLVLAADTDHWAYIGVSYGAADVNDDNAAGSNEPNPDLFIGRIGTHLHNNFSIELRGGINPGIRDTGSLGVKNVFALYLKPEITVANGLTVNLPFGYGAIKYDNGSGSNSQGESFSFGLGAEYLMNDNVALTADMVMADKEDSLTINTFTLGINYFFDLYDRE